ncbi:pectate lyase, partial [Moniliophthora roreri]
GSINPQFEGENLVDINTYYSNYGDVTKFSNTKVKDHNVICQNFIGNNSEAEPPKNGDGSDGKYCQYVSADVSNA